MVIKLDDRKILQGQRRLHPWPLSVIFVTQVLMRYLLVAASLLSILMFLLVLIRCHAIRHEVMAVFRNVEYDWVRNIEIMRQWVLDVVID